MGCGQPREEPIPEAEAARRPCPEETSGSADQASPDLGPRGPELASLQAERDVVRDGARRLEAGLSCGRDRLWGVGFGLAPGQMSQV